MNRGALILVVIAMLFMIMPMAAGCENKTPTANKDEIQTLKLGVLGPFPGSTPR